MRRVPPFPTLPTLAVLLFAAACGDSRPTAPAMSPGDANAVISDGSFGGNPDFFFLPTLAPDPRQNRNFDPGKFNGTLAPVVSVCRLQATTVAQVIASTPCVSGPALVTLSGSQVRVIPQLEAYLAVWNLRTAEPVDHMFYRVQVFVGTTRLGFFDMTVVTSIREARNAITGQVIPVPEDFLLPIPFRIERGALGACQRSTDCTEVSVTPQGGTFSSSTHHASVVLTPGWASPAAFAAGGGSIALTIERRPMGEGFPPCHGPTVTGTLYQQQNVCYHIATNPSLEQYGGFQTDDNIAAQCSVVQRVPGETGNLGEEWTLYKSDPGRPLQALDDRPEPPGLDCANFAYMEQLPSNPVLRYASLGWHSVTQAVGAVVGVREAQAWDLGLGGHLALNDFFSDFSWGKAAVKTKVSGDAQSVSVGTAVTPKVRLTGSHHGGPVSGVGVTFAAQTGSILSGDLSVSTLTVLTDANGEASVPWIVALGANTLLVTAPTLDPTPLTFTATGTPAASANLVISSFTANLGSPTVVDDITFTAVVSNTGAGSAPASSMTLRVGGETFPPSFPVPALAAGATFTVTRTLNLNVAQNYRAEAIADVGNAVSETNEADNNTLLDFSVTALTTSVTDPTNDDGEGFDFVSTAATVDRGNLVMQFRFRPGSFSSATTMITVNIDIDRNPATGYAGVDAAHNDASLMGVEYLIEAGSDYVGSTPTVLKYADGGFSSVKAGTLTFVNDVTGAPIGVDVTIPLSALGNARGEMAFKAVDQGQVGPGSFTGIMDYITDLGLAPGILRRPSP